MNVCVTAVGVDMYMYVCFYKSFGIFMNIIDKSKVTDILIISSES